MGPVVAPPGKRANCHFSFFHPISGCHLVNSTGHGGLQIRSALSPWVTGQGMARGLAPQRPVCFFGPLVVVMVRADEGSVLLWWCLQDFRPCHHH